MRRFSFALPLAITAAIVVLDACGGDSTGPETPSVDGRWNVAITNVSGNGISCSWTGGNMNLVQSGSTFSGTYSGGVSSWVGEGEACPGRWGPAKH